MAGSALAIDTSGSFCSVAVLKPDGAIVECSSSGEGDHFERLPGLVHDALCAAGLPASALASLRVGLGPGSFTGLRIGLSFAKGLASSLRVPLVGVGSFEGMAAAVLDGAPRIGRVVVLSDARRDEVFIGAFERAGVRGVKALVEPRIVPVADLAGAPWDSLKGPDAAWFSPMRDLVLAGFPIQASPSLAKGLLLCSAVEPPFLLSDIAALEPSYLRAVAAKTIEERRQGA